MSNPSGKNRLAFATRAIHGGQHPDPLTGAVMPPIYATSTYAQESPGVNKGYEYSRSLNPTRLAFENAIADLESGTKGFAFASGLAAISTTLELLDSGDHVIASDDLYGGSFRLFDKVRKRSAGLQFSFVDLSDLKALEAAIQPNTKMIWAETPTNPMLMLCDLEAIAALAKKRGLITAADNTFASPYVQRPLELGFDLVVHSTTKYLNGHSDIIGGLRGRAREPRARRGATQVSAKRRRSRSPALLTAIWRFGESKPWPCRMHRHCESAMKHRRLAGNSSHRRPKVIYPGPAQPPRNTSWPKRQMSSGFGGIITVVLKTRPRRRPAGAWSGVQIFTLAESLGGVESLIEHPAIMTHASIPQPSSAQALGNFRQPDPPFGRHRGRPDDLIEDLRQALDG